MLRLVLHLLKYFHKHTTNKLNLYVDPEHNDLNLDISMGKVNLKDCVKSKKFLVFFKK
jgi:hypothetical protein